MDIDYDYEMVEHRVLVQNHRYNDLSNAFMVSGATFMGKYDMPFSPTTAFVRPDKLIAYCDIKNVMDLSKCFVHFYKDDYKFDGRGGIWNNPHKALMKLKEAKGVITPDFSTWQDMPMGEKIHNTYRMRAFGYWLGKNGVQVINNVRWGTKETFDWCFDGLPKGDIYFLSTVGCNRRNVDKTRFYEGLKEMIERLKPKVLYVYGAMDSEVQKDYGLLGTKFVLFPSQSSIAFQKRRCV